MRYSQIFGKTLKMPPKEAITASHRLLIQAGFIDRALTSGIYSYLPLGWRVYQKIEDIIRQEMNAIGGQELFLPSLNPKELWEESGRWQTYAPPLFKLKDQHGHELCLAPTHEEVITDLCRRLIFSYRDLPLAVYQFQNKFRNEIRATGGLLRVREFIMKDLYSFHADQENLDDYYQKVYSAYEKIFKRCGVEARPVEASSGSIGGSFCHEFMLFTEAGEDRIFACDSCEYQANVEKAEFVLGPVNPAEKEKPFKIVAQPEWVETMEDNVKHYQMPKSRFLKNVVYKTPKGTIIITVIRGDLTVNEIKLTQVVGEGVLTPATDRDLKKMGTRAGWVHCWGHQGAKYIGDFSLQTVKNFIGGQKEKTTDSINVNYGRDFAVDVLADIAEAQAGFTCVRCKKGKLREIRGIELGHVFKLGTKYSKTMGAEYPDKDGKKQLVWMGCYGIGLGRLMAAIVENNHDPKGIIWPAAVAPYMAHLINLNTKKADEIYKKLTAAGIETLYDDREDVSAGEKFADADLIGCPVRLVVSGRTGDKIEWKNRNSQKIELLEIGQVVKKLTSS